MEKHMFYRLLDIHGCGASQKTPYIDFKSFKGHLVSEGNFGVFKSLKKRPKFFEGYLSVLSL